MKKQRQNNNTKIFFQKAKELDSDETLKVSKPLRKREPNPDRPHRLGLILFGHGSSLLIAPLPTRFEVVVLIRMKLAESRVPCHNSCIKQTVTICEVETAAW